MPKVSFADIASEKWLIQYEWKVYRDFLNSLDGHVSGVLLDLEQIIVREDDEEQREFLREFNEDYYYDLQQFKAILLNSFFTASYALFEHQLMRLCRRAKLRCKSPFSVDDIKGYATVERVKTYLTKLEITFPSEAPEWKSINQYREIRNKIAHNGGVVSKEWGYFADANARGIIKPSEVPPDSSEPPRYIKVTRPFCDDAINDFMNFLQKVYEAIYPVESENASIWGYLSAVDWTHKTARLERIVGKPVPLKFDDALSEDMRRFATKYVQIHGAGVINAADEWATVKVTSIEGDRDMFKPFDIEEFLAQPRKPFRFEDLKPPSEPFDVDEFNRIIREGRDVGKGRDVWL